jgi:hypothetical protein
MADTALVQSWFVRVGRQEIGVYDEVQLLAFIRGGLTEAQIRPDSADDEFPWLPLGSHPPFATALGEARESGRGRSERKHLRVGSLLVIAAVGSGLGFVLAVMVDHSLKNRAAGNAVAPAPSITGTGGAQPMQLSTGDRAPRVRRRLSGSPIKWRVQVSGAEDATIEPQAGFRRAIPMRGSPWACQYTRETTKDGFLSSPGERLTLECDRGGAAFRTIVACLYDPEDAAAFSDRKEYWHIALGKTLAGPFTGLTVECWHSEGRLQGGTSLPAPRSDFLEGAK